jgi:hypothetical protein
MIHHEQEQGGLRKLFNYIEPGHCMSLSKKTAIICPVPSLQLISTSIFKFLDIHFLLSNIYSSFTQLKTINVKSIGSN